MADYEDDNVSDEYPGVSLHFFFFRFCVQNTSTFAAASATGEIGRRFRYY